MMKRWIVLLGLMFVFETQAAVAEDVTARVAAARDAVMPYVVSVMVVRADQQAGRSELHLSSGSGTIIRPDGYVATNAHVTENGRKFRVVLADKRELQADLVGEDALSDIAVLKIRDVPPGGFQHARFAASDRLQSGDVVLAMGAPWGMAHSLTQGVVNNPERLMISLFQDESDYEQQLGKNQPTARYYAWIQHDAAIAPGNSGGPLVDLSGEIVGINTRGNLFGGDMAFAIPATIANTITTQLIQHGEVPRSYFGFGLRSLKNSGLREGVLVSSVQGDSPADRAGLKPGDRILAVDAQRVDITQPEQVPPLLRALTERKIGSELSLTVARTEGERILRLRAETYPKDLGEDIDVRAFGLTVTEVTPSISRSRQLDRDDGLLVTGVAAGKRAATAHPPLQIGDVIYQLDQSPIRRGKDLQAVMADEQRAKGEWIVHIERRSEMLVALIDAETGASNPNTLRELPKAWIGIETQPVTPTTSRKIGGPEAGGYRVTRVYPGPAEAAGIKVGDFVQKLAGETVPVTGDIGDESLQQRIRDALLGEPLAIDLVRGQTAMTVSVQPQATPTPPGNLPGARIDWLDLNVRSLSFFDRVDRDMEAGARGVVVERVESGGLGGLAFLQVGDVILEVNGQPVTDLKRFEALVDRKNQDLKHNISFLVLRANRTRLLFLDSSWMEKS